MQAPRRLQLRRGNAVAISSYVGAPGEVTINTSNWSLNVHNGITPGGIVATANTTMANTGTIGFNNNTIRSTNAGTIRLSPLGNGGAGWDFDPDGRITLPGNLLIDSTTAGFDTVRIGGANVSISIADQGAPPGFYINTDSLGDQHTWLFSAAGSMLFPDSTAQTTAWTGGYVPAVSGNWATPAPTTITAAIDRLAALVKTLNSGTGA